MTGFGRILLILIACCASHAVVAHPAPFSFVDIRIDQAGTQGTLTLHDFDAANELRLANPEVLRNPAVARAQQEALVALAAQRLRFVVDGEVRQPTWGVIAVVPERQSLRLPFALGPPARGQMEVAGRLFPYDPAHQTFVNIYDRDALRHQAILDTGRSETRHFSASAQGRWAVIRTFVASGIHHILIGPDHILFILGLILLGGSLRRLALIVTAFTLGHSVTLSLAALGIVRLSPLIVEPAIALSILVVGIDNLIVLRQRRLGTAGRDLRPSLAGLFGLIHGFGFAAVLAEFGLPPAALGWSLAAFNLGVEIGQLAIVAATLALAGLFLRAKPVSARATRQFVTIGSIAVAVAGFYWFVERVWFV